MKIKAFILIIVLIATFILYQNFSPNVYDFGSCAEAGNPVMESYPRQCAHEGVTYIEDISIKCTESQRDVQFCTLDYTPVCATVNVQCITEPCDPVKETYSNACGACSNRLVESYVPGECF